jgi:hypothetical protein
MQNERVIRTVAFVVFFSIGAAVLSATTLCDDLLKYYYYKGLLSQSEERLKKLESLNADYDTLLAQVEGNPKELARLAPATLGIEANEPNTAYPRATAGKLAAARRALAEEPNQTTIIQGVPPWLGLCCQWPRRHILFISGATLVLISFVFFGPTRDPSRTMTVTSSGEHKVEPGQTAKTEPQPPPPPEIQ